jgi:acetolactate synthase-1/3 small subunit
MENKPGVLSRISTLLARRNFNVDSITASPTSDHDVTRMTVVVEGDQYVADNAANEIGKLEDVVEIEMLNDGSAKIREIILMKLGVDKANRGKIIDIAKVYDCKIVDATDDTIMIEHSDKPENIDTLLKLVSEFELISMARGGAVALRTGDK